MQRLLAAIDWFVQALGRSPLDDDLALGMYREIEFGVNEPTIRAAPVGVVDEAELLRRAS
jgi:hypothetical protein